MKNIKNKKYVLFAIPLIIFSACILFNSVKIQQMKRKRIELKEKNKSLQVEKDYEELNFLNKYNIYTLEKKAKLNYRLITRDSSHIIYIEREE